jgi:polysaccharide export outer membrane protein
MISNSLKHSTHVLLGLWPAFLLCAGCSSLDVPPAVETHPTTLGTPADVSAFHQVQNGKGNTPDLPHELSQVPLPTYVIAAPDVLQIDALRLIPKPPYKISPLDVLGIQVTNTLPDAPIASLYNVDPEGYISLGYTYPNVKVEGMSLEQARAAITEKLKTKLKEYEVTVVLVESRGLQQIRGQHLVRPDGTVGLGLYGSVHVDGLTIDEAKAAIESHLSQSLLKPEISLDVVGFNSMVYYIVSDGGGAGEQVTRLPMTGKTTILDAMSQVNGLSPVSSKYRVFLVRPTPAGCNADDQVYKVEWNNIVRRGRVGTNYQVLPGDRIYVYASPLVTTDTVLARILSPFERIFGTVGLGNSTVRQFLTPISTNGIVTTPGF